MARTIKRIAHDLSPLSSAVNELGAIISELMDAIQNHIVFDDPKMKIYFDECRQASQKLALSANLINDYINEIHEEADREGIDKD